MYGLATAKCTACAACMNVCPTEAVFMEYDSNGLSYPRIDSAKCIKCMRCEQICPLMNPREGNDLSEVQVYAMQSNNRELRMHSTSGGAFSELANTILENGGRVVGAVYKQDWSVEHRMIEKATDLEELRRSKYQQSNVGYTYRKIKRELLDGKEVLFCGTPCQVGGLKAYLQKTYDNLFLCDFICRGVPSPGLFQEYIKNLQEEYGSEITSIWMKNKRNGWHSLTTVITFANGQEYVKNGWDDSYVQLFLKYNIGIRPSCYQCQFKAGNDVADITLGDFWGLEGTTLDDNLGTSAIICRTVKGQQLYNRIRDRVLSDKMSLDDIKRGNPCFDTSVEMFHADETGQFFSDIKKYGYNIALKKLSEKEK